MATHSNYYRHYREEVRQRRERREMAKAVAVLVLVALMALLAGTMDYHDAQLMSTDVPGHVAEWQEGALDE